MSDEPKTEGMGAWNAGIATILIVAGIVGYFFDKDLWVVFIILAFLVMG